ncbi:MAG: DUF3040 domain-containing protein [Actinomycetota bacterium]
MPLSEHEQRLLEQMERALYAEDPKFATSLRSGPGRASRGRAALGVLVLFAGVAMLMVGVNLPASALGVAGFVVMIIGAALAYSGLRGRPAAEGTTAEGAAPAASAKAPKQSSGFMNKLEDRWRRRRDEGLQ